MDTMQILMVIPQYPFPVGGGAERQAHELARTLVRKGHSVQVLSTAFDPTQSAEETIDGVQVSRVPWIEERGQRFVRLPAHMLRILFRIRSQIDVVHLHNLSSFCAFVGALAKLAGIPVVTKLPNFGIHGIPGMQRRRGGWLRVALLKRADAVVAMMPESRDELLDIGHSTGRTLKVVNGIGIEAPEPNRSTEPMAPLRAVFVGRLVPEKCVSDLLHAWRIVKDRAERPVSLRLLGDGPEEEGLRQICADQGIDDSVEFFGFCHDVPSELARADIFTLSSSHEGNSNAILEAMRAGLPIAATRVGGAAMQVGESGQPWLVRVHHPEELAQSILGLIEDDALRRDLGASMRARIEEIFAIERIAGVYEQAYERIVSGRREEVGDLNATLFEGVES